MSGCCGGQAGSQFCESCYNRERCESHSSVLKTPEEIQKEKREHDKFLKDMEDSKKEMLDYFISLWD